MSGAESLECGYRRLLAWYPARHRQAHEEEMLGVLLAAAREGQQRPRLSEAANLIWGALLIRLRPAPAGDRHAAWRDALAVFSVAGPLLLLVLAAASLMFYLLIGSPLIGFARAAVFSPLALVRPGFLSYPLPVNGPALLMAAPLVLAILALLRFRLIAILTVLATAIGLAYLLVATPEYGIPGPVFAVSFVVLETAALTLSPGPRRGLVILTKTSGMLLAIVAAIALATFIEASGPEVFHLGVALFALATIVVIVAGLAIASPLTRHVLLLFAAPGVPFVLMLTPLGYAAPGLDLALVYLPPLVIAVLVVAAILRARRRAIPGSTPAAPL